jgi:DNA polymerase-4
MILYVYVPGFYAAVEQADHPDLHGRPTVVGGDPRKHGLVTSVSAEAAARGVRDGMPMVEALERCPDAQVRPTRMRRYREMASAVLAVCWRYTERLEPSGLDGVYLDLPDSADPLETAAEVCLRVRSEAGVPAVGGLGPTRFVAHAAARHCGEGGIRRVSSEEAAAFLADLPVTEIWGLGPASAGRLEEHGIRRIGDLQGCTLERLEEIVGRLAPTFHRLALGQDNEGIRPRPRPKSISQEKTLEQPTADLATLREEIADLAGRLAAILEREGRTARTVTLGLGFLDDQEMSRVQTEPQPVFGQAEIREIAVGLLGRARPEARMIRRLRLQLTNLSAREHAGPPRQLTLF